VGGWQGDAHLPERTLPIQHQRSQPSEREHRSLCPLGGEYRRHRLLLRPEHPLRRLHPADHYPVTVADLPVTIGSLTLVVKNMPKNKLNDLDTKTWLKFQKSWFIHNPPPRKKNVL